MSFEQGDLFSQGDEDPRPPAPKRTSGPPAPPGAGKVVNVALHDVTRNKFLNYAVSVITSRALPDVRDGLKPVQRRILYTMHHDLHLSPEKSTLKCAKVVGQVLGNYHPHGDGAVYEALVRLAQPWSLRYPLIFGQGNFGSLDGDAAAAYRYTEARLTPIAMEFVAELGANTVEYRPNFDDSSQEPVVLPARVPQLLINGCTGIAVGVATNIPPHNLGEVCDALSALIDDRDLSVRDLLKKIKGPDFPTGGEILEDRQSLIRVYEDGQGRIRLRGQYTIENEGRKGPNLVITSVPYMVNKSQLVEQIAELIIGRKIPQLVDVRDESTDEVRIVLECRKDADLEAVMAYLYKNTQLQTSFHVNMTCLVPSEDGVGAPARLSLSQMLLHFLDFRQEVVVRRLTYELAQLKARIHILEGMRRVFDGLDEAIEIIRNSDGRAHAQEQLMARFSLDEAQADAVLDLRLYRLGRPDIQALRKELLEKEIARDNTQDMLDSPRRIWGQVRAELEQVRKLHNDPRRSQIRVEGASDLEYSDDAFIVAEEAVVVLSRDGWLRRVSTGTDLSRLKWRTDDVPLAVLRGSTLSSLGFFSSLGVAYTIRFNDIPVSSRGFGDPVQKFFNFKDGERVVAAVSFDPEVTPGLRAPEEDPAGVPALHALALSSDGRGLRFSLEPLLEASTRSGRKYARPAGSAEVVAVLLTRGQETLVTVSRAGRALLCAVEEVNFLAGAGRGVTVLKLGSDDRILGVALTTEERQGLTVIRVEGGREIPVTPAAYRVATRGGKGTPIIKRGQLMLVETPLELAPPSGETPGTPTEGQE